MHAHKAGVVAGDIALDENDVFVAMRRVGEDAELPFAAEFAGHGAFFGDGDKVVVAAAIGDQVADRADLQVVALREGDEIGQTRHGAVFVHDLADHARGVEAGKAGDVDRCLGMACADEDAAIAGAQGEDVAGRRDVLRALA